MKLFLVKIGLATGGLIFGLLIVELLLRVIPYEGNRERDKLSSRFNPYYSSPLPVLKSFPSSGEDKNNSEVLEINDQRIVIKKRPTERRILFIGDSGTLGSGVKIDESSPLRFKALLDSSYPNNNYSVINAGRKGLSTVGELRLLQDDLLFLEPDIVVLGLFMANDLNFNLAHADVENISHMNASFLKTFYFLRRYSALVHFLYLRMLALNGSYGIIENLGLQHSTCIPIEYRLIDERGLNMMSYLEGEVGLYFAEPSSLAREAFTLLEKLLNEFKVLSVARGFKFVVVIIPTYSSIVGRLDIPKSADALKQLKDKGIELSTTKIEIDGPLNAVQEICSQIKIPCINPLNELRAYGSGSLLKDDDHLSTTGHELVAQSILERFKAFKCAQSQTQDKAQEICLNN